MTKKRNDPFENIEMRKAQETLANLINGGYHKELIRLYRSIYVSCVEEGFIEEQAIELTKEFMRMTKC